MFCAAAKGGLAARMVVPIWRNVHPQSRLPCFGCDARHFGARAALAIQGNTLQRRPRLHQAPAFAILSKLNTHPPPHTAASQSRLFTSPPKKKKKKPGKKPKPNPKTTDTNGGGADNLDVDTLKEIRELEEHRDMLVGVLNKYYGNLMQPPMPWEDPDQHRFDNEWLEDNQFQDIKKEIRETAGEIWRLKGVGEAAEDEES